MTQKENEILNILFNVLEYTHSEQEIDDLFWFCIGLVNDSVAFNIIEYILDRLGFIKQ